MKDFLKKYGFESEAKFLEHVKSDAVFAVTVVSDLLAEKFPSEFPHAIPEDVVAEPESKAQKSSKK